MAIIRKILFPVDFSDSCLGASRFVEDIAGRFQAEVTFLHAVSQSAYMIATPDFGGLALVESYQAGLKAARERMSSYLAEDFKHFDVNRLVVEGDPALKIIEFARQNGTDLIMMPTHGLGPFRRFLLGSITAKVLHDAECPVWSGAHLENAPPLEKISFHKVVCAVDLGPQSERTLQWAAAFAQEHAAELIVLHVVPGAETRPSKYLDRDLVDELAHQATADLTALLGSLGIQGRIVIEGGEPAKRAQTVVESENADLLVIARGAVTEGLGRLRTHSYSIIRSAPCPVVSI
jgi:nucleotide-binding universal stress UspA family protein